MNRDRDTDDFAVHNSTGDVFVDLGLHLSEEDMLKVVIARAISRVLNNGNYTQAKAGAIMGLDQPKVSKLLRGKLKDFSADRLIECLLALGYDVEVKYKKTRARDRGKIRLVAA